MTDINRADTDLVVENRQLRQALETLLDELESNSDMGANGNGPNLSRVREKMPNRDQNGIQPPWEREGYETKEEWLAGKRGN